MHGLEGGKGLSSFRPLSTYYLDAIINENLEIQEKYKNILDNYNILYFSEVVICQKH